MAEVPQRQAYGMALAEYGDVNPDVVVLDADVSSSTLTKYFADRHPSRFFNLGVTEASMVNVGVGLALSGRIPFVNTFAALLTLRACEQIRTCVAYANANVKLIGGYAGLSDYKDGPTHFAINDVALMRAMPNVVVIAPADNIEAARMVRAIAEHEGPVYMRISRAAVPDVFGPDHQVHIGKGIMLRSGNDVTIIGSGSMMGRCVRAADQLVAEGVSVRLLNIHTLKPLDVDLICQAAEETGALVTAEDHSVIGGLGGAVAEALGRCCPAVLEYVGLQDTFAGTGLDTESLMDAWGLAVQDIVNAARRAMERKARRR
ncbi:MAG: transketolase family protein [Anaerolineae bacterium]|nr:transketolase family protein [Anaerolineae bacterium]